MTNMIQAYWLQGTEQELRRWASFLGSPVYFWIASLVHFRMGHGLPQNWLEQGGVFSGGGELRWWKEGEQYEAVLFSEHEIAGLQHLEGLWEAQEKDEDIFLQDLAEPRVHPPFNCYPHGESKGRLRAKVYRRDGATVWISPRAFMSDQEGGQP